MAGTNKNMKLQDVSFIWRFDEFEKHQRGTLWYAVSGIVVAAFLIYSYLTENYLFGLLVLITTVIIFTHNIHNPQEVECEIDASGIRIGNKRYPFHGIDCFSIIENDDGQDVLYVQEKSGFRSQLPIPIVNQDTEHMRKFLSVHIEEDIEHKYEPLWDSLSRFLKL
ncbi:hypothetical protein HY621_01555 [Candidatus Uhrbacteria bacterium]|nr:hypothetical protein [Candidatus Uhrbacteria bacterium]